MAIVRNHRSYPLDLTGGHVLGPEETANVDLANEHEAALVASGALVVVDPDTPPPAPLTPPGNWLASRETVAALPTTGNNDGDVRFVRADRSPYEWAAADAVWSPLSAQGGSGVLVQQDEPTDVAVNTLWVEIDDADPPNIVAVHVAVA
jgi:hypothetical protein